MVDTLKRELKQEDNVLDRFKKFQLNPQSKPSYSLTMKPELSFNPASFQDRNNPDLKFKHGTTTLAMCYDAGITVAVDSRASMGSYIGSGTVKKVLEINDYLLGTMAGGAADCMFWERQLNRQCMLYQLRQGKRITVNAASKILWNTVRQYKGYGLSMGTMIVGVDEETGPRLYYVDSDGQRLVCNDPPYFSVGSGSTHAYGIIDAEYRRDMTHAEAAALGQSAILHATHRDAYSGGWINVYQFNQPSGKWTKLSSDDCYTKYKQWKSQQSDYVII